MGAVGETSPIETSPLTPEGGVTSIRQQGINFVQQSAVSRMATAVGKGLMLGSFAVATPLFLPQGENQGLSFNVLAAIPLLYKLTKSDRLGKFQPTAPPDNSLFFKTPPSGAGGLPFVPETTGTAYLLVELLDENGDFVREVDKYYVSSQDEFTKIGNTNEETVDFGNECTQTGFLRFSLVNEHNHPACLLR